ncbi:Riboflavin biosynthesis protein RibBA [Poriferisphaera corsica]|uniref:3,4-dihydroxy-2-butanone 4-phosphate synthase n=1 Tax=Poriferisphaera corsica TaxID=2528020 RepID=A0A517YQ20_9BACT|nr:3,4-dihydroxy-2-butanone-4-phosphate synthase [Poriferisphaera corsica]QDU32310.1 Riboflavin biosynthesis protein RibBA [Poriferisphaera corsica]
MEIIPEILDELRQGRMIILADDESRENEGDLVCAAEFATPENINFMLREGRGLLCVALSGEVCDHLDLGPLAAVNTSQLTTAYTVTVDGHARFGVTTGVSTLDRSITCKLLADPNTKIHDLARPGHVQPLRARDGGCLVRAGQTEGSVDLCKLAGLQPAAVIFEVMNPDGTMARRPELEKFCKTHNIKMCTTADVIEYRMQRDKLITRIAEQPIETPYGTFTLIAYRSQVDPFPHVALVCGDVGTLDGTGNPIEHDDPILVRMHSQNILGDVFGDQSQPSGVTLHKAMQKIQSNGSGAIVYLRHDSMGTGVLKDLQTASLPANHELAGEDRIKIGAAHETPGIKPPKDKREYGIGSQILRDLGVRKLDLLTNHPFTPTALSGFGLEIDNFVPIK